MKSRDGQGLSPWTAPLAVAAAILWSWVAIAQSLPESLWLDELHSVWCATGTSGEVFHRAALGNQLSTYFWLLRWMGQTFGTSEAVWRAPSVGAWLGVVALCGWWLGRLAGRRGRPLALVGLGLIVADRLQIFYATEARPYALVALVNLLAWLTMAAWSGRWFRPPGSGGCDLRAAGPLWLSWCALNGLACWLQPTAVLSVAAQYVFLFGAWLSLRRTARISGEHWPPKHWSVWYWPAWYWPAKLWPMGLGALVFALSMLPALHVLWPVWEHRQRWAAFAAGTHLSDVLLLLPFTPFAGPLAIGALVHGLLSLGPNSKGRGSKRRVRKGVFAWFACDADEQTGDKAGYKTGDEAGDGQRQDDHVHAGLLQREWWMWLAAWALPCAMVYLLTASGIAPLMHRRYVFVAAAPFVLWIASSVVCLRGRGLRLAVWCAMIAVLLVQQGSLQAWREGSWPAAVRGEDWRGAARWINSQTDPEKPVVVFCASNLIEGAGAIPADEMLGAYLTLPLRSIYRIEAASRIVPLANDPASWSRTVAAETARQEQPAWLVVRSSAAGWERRLQASGLSVGDRRDYGGVQVARDVGFKKMP